jgi:hypothetical protein
MDRCAKRIRRANEGGQADSEWADREHSPKGAMGDVVGE